MPLEPRGPVDVLLPKPVVVLGLVVEERGSFVPTLLLARWLPWPVVVPVVPACAGSSDRPEPYMTSSSFELPGFLEVLSVRFG